MTYQEFAFLVQQVIIDNIGGEKVDFWFGVHVGVITLGSEIVWVGELRNEN